MWMVGTSLVLIVVAVLFLRNQIRPIERLADAAEGLGQGRPVDDFEPRGAREVRRAAEAFIGMRRRIERQIEQRTTMLAGVSHDLRTILTRFRLQLALLEDNDAAAGLKQDISEMEEMLEAYVAFAKGDGDEEAREIDITAILRDLAAGAELTGATVDVRFAGDPMIPVRPNAIKRCLINLVVNACRYGDLVIITGSHKKGWLTITVDDDGPGHSRRQARNGVQGLCPGWTRPAIRMMRAQASAWRLRATSRAITAGTSNSPRHRSGDCGQPCAFRASASSEKVDPVFRSLDAKTIRRRSTYPRLIGSD